MNQLKKLPGWSGKLPEADCDNIVVLLKYGKPFYYDCDYGWISSDGEVIHIDAGTCDPDGGFPTVTKIAEIPLSEISFISYRDLITRKIEILTRITPFH